MNSHPIYPNKAGVYKLTNIINGKIYIGKTTNFRLRLNKYKNYKSACRVKSHLKNAILKYGWDSFMVEFLEIYENFDTLIDNSKILEKESFYIKLFDSTNRERGYNICEFSTDRTGIPMSSDTKEKLRVLASGKKFTDEHKRKISQSKKGVKFTDEHRKKLCEAKLKNPMSQKHKEALRLANLNKKISEETRLKLRNSMLGRTVSDDTRQKLIWTDEKREKIRQTKLKNKQLRESIENESTRAIATNL